MADIVQQVVENSLLEAAKQIEQQIDSQLHQLDNLNDDDLENIRQRRIDEMKRMQNKRQEWLQKGHGQYQEIQTEKDFFKEMKGEERMVCHFFRENWPCKVMDKHMGILAKQHLETKFVRINAEKSPFLTERLKIWMLPTLALVKHEKTVDYVCGFDELGGSDDFATEVLAARLAQAGVLNWEEPVRANPVQRSIRKGGPTGSDEDSDFDD